MSIVTALLGAVYALVRGLTTVVTELRDASDDTPRLHQVRPGLAALVAERQAEIKAAQQARRIARRLDRAALRLVRQEPRRRERA